MEDAHKSDIVAMLNKVNNFGIEFYFEMILPVEQWESSFLSFSFMHRHDIIHTY